MPRTNEIVERLVADLRPVAATAVARRLAAGVAGGMLASAAVMLAVLGPRPDLPDALDTGAYWIKFAYTLALGGCAFFALDRLARPGGRAPHAWAAAAIVLSVIAAAGVGQWAAAPPGERMPLVMGTSASRCPWLIVVLSLPILAGASWAVRGLAPTHLARAGLAVGLCAGGLGAWIYAFHCYEQAIPFLALWYTLGIAAVGALGALSGRLLLRW